MENHHLFQITSLFNQFTSLLALNCSCQGPAPLGKSGVHAVHSVRLSSVLSGDRSANPASVPGCSGLQRAHISVSSARKRSGAEMLATPSGVSRAASSAFSCRCAVPGYQTGRSDYTSVSHRVLPVGFGFTSLVFLGDDTGLRTVASIGDFG